MTVEVREFEDEPGRFYVLAQDSSGTRNDASLEVIVGSSDATFRITDTSGVTNAATGCASVSETVVDCPLFTYNPVFVDTGPGADTARMTGYARSLDGEGVSAFLLGDGNDRFYGSGGTTVAVGGRGRDRLVGGSAPDHFFGGRGDDVLLGRGGPDGLTGGPGADRLVGGKGKDSLIQH